MHVLVRTLAPAVLVAATLSACGSSSTTPSNSSSPSASGGSAALTIADAWCKSTDSMPEGKKEMTGCFGTLTNTTDAAITISGGMSPTAGMVELHETVMNNSGQMQMQPKSGGFVVPAKGTFELKPGANHVMVMMLKQEIKTGDMVAVTLKTTAGDIPLSFSARAFSGANESYVPSPSMSHSHS